MINNRLFTRNNQLFLSAAAENTFILEILTDFTVSDKDIQKPINSPPICLHKWTLACIKTNLGEIIKIRDT